MDLVSGLFLFSVFVPARSRAGTKTEKVGFVLARDRAGTKTETKSRYKIQFLNPIGIRFPQSAVLVHHNPPVIFPV